MTSTFIVGALLLVALVVMIANGTLPLLSVLKSKIFWLILCLAAAGWLGYQFRDQIWNWGAGVISSPWWKEHTKELMVAAIIIAALLVLLGLWKLLGKDRVASIVTFLLKGGVVVGVVLMVLSTVSNLFPHGCTHQSILTTEGKGSGYIPQTISITPDHPLQSVYKESWDGYIEYPEAGKVVYLYIPLNGKPVYQGGNLVVDQSRVLRMELGKPTHTTMERGQDRGWRFYWTEEGESATVTIKLN